MLIEYHELVALAGTNARDVSSGALDFYAQEPHSVAFYTVFCGTSDNAGNQVHEAPSSIVPCYYFTDNSKKMVQEEHALHILKSIPSDKPIAIREHNFIKPPVSVWREFQEAMNQERYAWQRSQMEHYIKQKLSQGYLETLPIHFWCSFIIRNMRNDTIKAFGETWYSNILDCGIEDQVSMFFVYQDFPDSVYALPSDATLASI